MSQKKFIRDISASTIQIGVTQVANLLIFYLISKYISKEEFGFYNWAVALSSTIITVLSFGMDLVYVKRVASEYKPLETINLHFFHTLFSGIILIICALIISSFLPHLFQSNLLFLLILINQVCFSIANSIKLCINGHERYNYLAYIAVSANVLKISLILLLFFTHNFSLQFIIYSFIFSYLTEFLMSYYLANKIVQERIKPKVILSGYKELITESLPQLGTVLFDSALARIDWILMGILATAVKTAEYSFTFKIFEISKLPYLILAPILLTRFSKLFKKDGDFKPEDGNKLDDFFKLEMFIAILIPVMAITIWSDFFDWITDNKYGRVNELTYQLLAVCIPLHYATNFLWTMAFTQGQLKKIFLITAISSSLNICLNFVLIPVFGAEGAALSFLVSTIIQIILYQKMTLQDKYRFKQSVLLTSITIGIIAILSTRWLEIHTVFKLIFSVLIYILLSIFTGLFNIKTLKSISI